MKNRFRMTLRKKLILSFALILFAPSLAIAYGSYSTAKADIRQQLVEQARDNVQLLNQLIDRNVQPTVTDVEFLAQRLKAGDEAANLLEPLNQYENLHKELMHTYIGTASGKMLIAPQVELPKDFDPRQRPWYRQAMADTGKTVITEPYVDTDTKQITVTIARATADGQGVVAADLSLEALAETVHGVHIGKQGYAAILDKNHKLLVHPAAEIGSEAKGDFLDTVYQAPSGQLTTTENGKSEELLFSTNTLTGWKLIGTLYLSEATDAAQPIFMRTLATLLVAFVIGAGLVYAVIRSIMRPIRTLIAATKALSEGDLTQEIHVHRQDELGSLSVAFNVMRESLHRVLLDVMDTSMHLASSSEQLSASSQQTSKATEHIAETIEQLAVGTDEQTVRVESSTRAVEEMSIGIRQIAGNAQTVSQSAALAANLAQNGSASMNTAISQMQSIQKTVHQLAESVRDLAARSQQIGEIVNVITGIAAQTNLLALNAAIEASRAGEHGRGFAVVADEVRKLAEQSSGSARQIAELVVSIQSGTHRAITSMEEGIVEVDAGIGVVNEANDSFQQIQDAVEHVTTQVQEVTASAQQMTIGVEHVVLAIQSIADFAETAAAGSQNVSAATEEQLASMEEIASTSEALSKMADELQGLLAKFKI
ncbi:methyl-accepting chemotaxis protein [Tumebacillus flagellatus]|uniref:Chemotaxis protein n=1 Tax=Tumebacillus flagellatus TaxID=1157490 RepID=A0A074LJG5_9BACL|nr:methyl-accepting chemotaxis protein [Tumebacillus flagellatus]KEO82321.1 chemotaxis protein [Tumebacillus flagellatus]